MRTSVLLRGIEGFGAKHHLRTDVVLTLSEDLPLVSVAVDTPDHIEGLISEVQAFERHGLVTLERAQAAPAGMAGETKLTIYVSRRDSFVPICRTLERWTI